MKWNIEKVIKEARKYETIKDFKKNSNAYQWAIKHEKGNKLIWSHFKKPKDTRIKHTIESVIKEARKHKTRGEFQKSCASIYVWCHNNGHLKNEDIFGHMVKPKPNRVKWNLENATLEALKYKSRKEFEINSAGAYKWCRTNKSLDLVCSHMKKNFIEWNLDLIIEIARKYKSKGKFIIENSGAYGWISRNNHKDNNSIFGHMENQKSGFNKDKKAILYYLKIGSGIAYKIGITNRSITERFCKEDLDNIEVLYTLEFTNGGEAKKEEYRILQEFKYAKYNGEKLLKDGNTELFSSDILNLDKNKKRK